MARCCSSSFASMRLSMHLMPLYMMRSACAACVDTATSPNTSSESYLAAAPQTYQLVERLHQVAALRVTVVVHVEVDEEGGVVGQVRQRVQYQRHQRRVFAAAAQRCEH